MIFNAFYKLCLRIIFIWSLLFSQYNSVFCVFHSQWCIFSWQDFKKYHPVKNFPGRAALSALSGSIWIIVLLWEGLGQTLSVETEAKGSTLPGREDLGRFRSVFFALPSPFFSPRADASGSLPTCVHYSSRTTSPHTWELIQDSPLDPLVLDNDWRLASRILLWSKGKASSYYHAPSTQRSPPVFSPFPQFSLILHKPLQDTWAYALQFGGRLGQSEPE